jgi:hypothetical protein
MFGLPALEVAWAATLCHSCHDDRVQEAIVHDDAAARKVDADLLNAVAPHYDVGGAFDYFGDVWSSWSALSLASACSAWRVGVGRPVSRC